MKIAIITAGNLPVPAIRGGAVEVLTTYIINGLVKDKNDVDVYTIKDKNLNKLNKKNLKIYQFQYTKISFLIYRCINYIFKLLKKDIVKFPYDRMVSKKLNCYEYDIIIVENNLCLFRNVYNKYSKTHKNTKFIFHIHNKLGDYRSEQAYKFVTKNANKVIYVSEFIKKSCDKIIECANQNILYNCVDFNIFKPSNKKIELRKNFLINKKDIVFCFSGRIVEDKGVLELVQAFNKLYEKYSNIALMIIGSQSFKLKEKEDWYFKKLNEEINENDKIIFTGFVSPKEIPKYLNISDVIVIPSKWEEPFGVSALEAMAMKKTIISTGTGGLSEFLDKESSVIVDKENLKEELYTAMEMLYLDESLREKLAVNGYKKVHKIKEFDYSNYYLNFKKIIK